MGRTSLGMWSQKWWANDNTKQVSFLVQNFKRQNKQTTTAILSSIFSGHFGFITGSANHSRGIHCKRKRKSKRTVASCCCVIRSKTILLVLLTWVIVVGDFFFDCCDSCSSGVMKLVRHLDAHHIPQGVATSCYRDLFELKTTNHKELFNYFHTIVTGDDPKVKVCFYWYCISLNSCCSARQTASWSIFGSCWTHWCNSREAHSRIRRCSQWRASSSSCRYCIVL